MLSIEGEGATVSRMTIATVCSNLVQFSRLGFKTCLSKTKTKINTLMSKAKTETRDLQDQYGKSTTGTDCAKQSWSPWGHVLGLEAPWGQYGISLALRLKSLALGHCCVNIVFTTGYTTFKTLLVFAVLRTLCMLLGGMSYLHASFYHWL